ncbi:hypothetical protein [Actinoplanes sp. NPDC051494]|uniref:hypothetical protein n=1 Tax=Actinoplanes sp. NPDC051494 TaxID=3363907 RepID=UPI0037AEC426
MDHVPSTDPDALYRRPGAEPEPARLPAIADFWPDAPHRMGPPADHYTEEPLDDGPHRITVPIPVGARNRTPPPPAPPHSSGRRRTLLGATLAVLLLAATGVVISVVARDNAAEPTAATPPAVTPSAAASPPANTLSAPVSGFDKASFEMVSDTNELKVRSTDLGDDLYRITTPFGGPILPRTAVDDGAVKLFLDQSGRSGTEEVEVLLNQDVRWRITMTGGVKRGTFDLSGGPIDGVDLAGGATRIDLTLPRPDGTLPIRMSGGVNQFEVRADSGVPVRLRTRRGAGQVTFEGRTDDGVAKEASFLSPGWQKSTDRIDVDAVAGIGSLQLDRL